MEFSREANFNVQSSVADRGSGPQAAGCRCGGGMPGGVFVLAHDAGEGVELQDCWPAEATWSVLGEVLLPAEGPAAHSRWMIMHQT